MNNAVHWSYGMNWGHVYALLIGSLREPRAVVLGPPFGVAVRLAGYALLPVARLSRPIWEYDARTLAPELAGHVLYGLGTAVAFQVLAGTGRRRKPRTSRGQTRRFTLR